MRDLVYVVRPGDDNEELRYSLRSVAENLPHGRIWVAGTVPSWLQNVEPLPLQPKGDKFDNQRQSLTAACATVDVSTEFVLMNDDHYVIEPIDPSNVPIYHLGPASAYIENRRKSSVGGINTWVLGLSATAEWMAHLGYGDVNAYEAHVPLVFDKGALGKVLDGYPSGRRFLCGVTYAATGAGGAGERGSNVKVSVRDQETLDKKLSRNMPYLSSNDDSFAHGAVGDWVRARFPTPSIYERSAPVKLNENAITSQKIAVGRVENPACWLLRDLAAQVPTNHAIVELGAFQGRTTGWLALGSHTGKRAPVYTVDPWEKADPLPADYLELAGDDYVSSAHRKAFEHHLDQTGIRPLVTVIQATAVDGVADYDGPPVGLLWHDALHRLADVRDDLRAWLPHMAKVATIVLHDVGDPRFEVEAGAKAALGRRKTWDWDGRETHLWPKQPDRRGVLIVRTVAR